MALLRQMLVGATLLTGCYSPELRDCAVSCVTSADCSPDQVCGADGMCAAPEIAGRCAGIAVPADAAVDSPSAIVVDAPMIDAPPPVDASTHRFLRIEMSGRGGVTVGSIGTCHHTLQNPCMVDVMVGATMSLTAVADPDNRFDKWEIGPCMGQAATCTLVVPMLLVTDLKVKFRQGEADD